MSTVIRAEFGNNDNEESADPDAGFNGTLSTPEECRSVSFNISLIARGKVDPAAFWTEVGKTKGYRAEKLAEIETALGLLERLKAGAPV